jgi:uncharacterized membrane protein YphA (DoxX/SURF4 family)
MFKKPNTRESWGLLILRLALALLFIWFGTTQLLHPLAWTAQVPDWAVSLSPFSVLTLVYLNGALEIFFGVTLGIGWYDRFSVLILLVHMLPILVSVGYGAILARDITITLSALSLFLLLPGKITENSSSH